MRFVGKFSADEKAKLTSYLQRVASDHCPFIEPSGEAGAMVFIRLERGQADLFSEYLRAAIIAASEMTNDQRAFADRALDCRNLCLESTGLGPEAGANLISRAHWVLKAIYSSRGLSIGKFWRDQAVASAIDQRWTLPTPPTDFLSIRYSVVTKSSGAFLRDYAELLTDVAARKAMRLEECFFRMSSSQFNGQEFYDRVLEDFPPPDRPSKSAVRAKVL